jgi:hypothetical protein
MKKLVGLFYALLPVIAVALVVTQVVISNELATLGKTLGKLDREIAFQDDIQEDLSIQVASISSLFAVRERALTMGFAEPTSSQIVSLTTEVPVALRVSQP